MLDTIDNTIYISCENPDCCDGMEIKFPYNVQGTENYEIQVQLVLNNWFINYRREKNKSEYYCPKCLLYVCERAKELKVTALKRREIKRILRMEIKLEIAERLMKEEREHREKEALRLMKHREKEALCLSGYGITNDGKNYVDNPNRDGYTIDGKRFTLNGMIFVRWKAEVEAKQREGLVQA